MAGSSNAKFLTPLDFTKPDENIAAKTTTEVTKPVLLPPSTYEKVETSSKLKTDREKATQHESSSYSENPEALTKVKDFSEDIVVKNHELEKAKRKISELEREKQILQNDLQDRKDLSKVVLQLKKDLRKSKEKLMVKEKDASGKTQEYGEMVRCLRTELQDSESKCLSLQQSYSKLVGDLRLLDETNVYLKRKLEAKELEFECMVRTKEQEIVEISMRLKGVLVERDLKCSMLMQCEEKYNILDESKKQVSLIPRRQDVGLIHQWFNQLISPWF